MTISDLLTSIDAMGVVGVLVVVVVVLYRERKEEQKRVEKLTTQMYEQVLPVLNRAIALLEELR